MSRTPALLLLAACSLRPYDWQADASATSTGAASTTTTGAITTSTTTAAPTSTGAVADTSSSSSTTGGSSGVVFIIEKDLGYDQCNILEQDCPEGQKCTNASLDGDNAFDAQLCVPIVRDPGGLYEPCTVEGSGVSGKDTCDIHLVCWSVDPDTGEGRCYGQCRGTYGQFTCEDPKAYCYAARSLLLCFPTCDPLAQDCGNGDVCIPDPMNPSEFICATDASGDTGQTFDPCEYVNDCDPGLICVNAELAKECDPMMLGCCLPFCDTSVIPAQCPGSDQECLPWYEMGMAPPGLENVGVCGLPL